MRGVFETVRQHFRCNADEATTLKNDQNTRFTGTKLFSLSMVRNGATQL